MGRTSIEWTARSWNPVRGTKGRHICLRISAGCKNCYAATMNRRFSGIDYVAGADVPRLDDKALCEPLWWRSAERCFVCSMTDLFWEAIPDEFIDRVFAVMALCPATVFQVLTKRPERMQDYCAIMAERYTRQQRGVRVARAGSPVRIPDDAPGGMDWPLPNVWLGVSVEDQATADERIPLLLQTPAALRWVSYEPALGPVTWDHACDLGGSRLSWIVAGGESGPSARPPHPDWFRVARDQCVAAGVPYFFKQWGEWAPHPKPPTPGRNNGAGLYVLRSGRLGDQGDYWRGDAAGMNRVGKKAAGALLDGREWREFPDA